MNRNRVALMLVTLALIISVYTGYRAYQQTEALLLESQDRHAAISALLDSTEFGYVICDQNLGIVEWNPAMERLTGYTKAEIQRDGFRRVLPEPILSDESEVFKDPTGTVRVSIVKCNLLTKAKELLPVEIIIRVIETARKGKYFVFHVDRPASVKSFTIEGGETNVTR